jgi:hypothetical protein
MADYHLLAIWRIEAPLEQVYVVIQNSLCWPDWWPGVQKVEQVEAEDADGSNNVRRYVWKGTFPYRMVFEVRATRIERGEPSSRTRRQVSGTAPSWVKSPSLCARRRK